jgi:transcriptional regulator GlxA family with amidase domain
MARIRAKTETRPPLDLRSRTIAVVAFDGISAFHLSVPSLVFGEDRAEIGVPRFRVRVCAAEAGPIRTTAGFKLDAEHGLEGLAGAAIVIVPSWRDPDQRPPQPLLAALQRAHARGATIVGLCLGAFVLAEAGLLDGRPATTHWHWAKSFGERYPSVRLDADVLYVDDGDVITSAGTVASIDCCLYILRRKVGAEIANRVARRLVVAPHRQGGQAQYIEQPVQRDLEGDRLAATLAWAASHLADAHGVDSLAKRTRMSRRTFTRRFREATGTSLNPWLRNQRVAAAQSLLEKSNATLDEIALAVGFGSTVSLRQHFGNVLQTSPGQYRRQFRVSRAS